MAAQLTLTNGPPRLRAVRVDDPRDHVLAGPGLAEEQHRGRRGGHLLDPELQVP